MAENTRGVSASDGPDETDSRRRWGCAVIRTRSPWWVRLARWCRRDPIGAFVGFVFLWAVAAVLWQWVAVQLAR